MAKPKKPLSSAQKAAKRKRRKEFEIVFINGKQKRIRREPTIDGLPVDEFVRRNADPIFLHQHGMHELLDAESRPESSNPPVGSSPTNGVTDAPDDLENLPF